MSRGPDLVALGVAVSLVWGGPARPHAAMQGPPPVPQAQQSFRTGTVVVEVDAIVTDAEGRFVPGLGADDFEVLEDGKPQRLHSLYVVTSEGVTLLPAPSAAPTEPPGVATPPPPGAGRLFILFFDEQHIDTGAFKRLQSAAVDFLQSEFREGDVGGVLVGTRMAGNRLTSKREELVAAVKEAKPSASRGMLKLDLQDWPRITQVEAIRIAIDNDQNLLRQVVQRAEREAPGGRQVADYTPNVLEKARYILAQLRVPARNTLTAFAGLVNGLARLPGRKTVVFMTDGFYIEEAGDAVRQIVGAAARANIRVYSIDAQGQNRRQQDTSLNALTPMETAGAIPAGAYDTTEDGPNSLAVDTGGMAIRNTNDFRSALSRVARDTSQYYVLGYVPANTTTDGKFRSITVRVKRPGLRVRARKGYVASAVAESAPAPPPATAAPAPPGVAAAPPAAAAPVAPAAAPGAGAATTAKETAGPPTLTTAAGMTMRPDARKRVETLAGGGLTPAPGSATLASQGWDRYSKGDLEGASKLLGQAAAEPGSAPWVSYALGFAEIGLGRPANALQAWERVRAAVPEFKDVWLDVVDAQLRLDDVNAAIEVLRQAHGRWPADTEILNALGTAEVRRGTLDQALAAFKKAAEAAPQEPLACFNLGRTYELRYYKTRRYSAQAGGWVANKSDLAAAIENYERYLKIGGPFEEQARQSLERLQWLK